MTEAYPIILTPAEEGGYIVYIPDFDINTQGETIAEALFMARDAIGLTGISKQDLNQPIPKPSFAIPSHNDSEIVSWVDIDFTEYRRKHDNRTIRRNITLPAWLDEAAKDAGINVSGFVQTALKSHLQLNSTGG